MVDKSRLVLLYLSGQREFGWEDLKFVLPGIELNDEYSNYTHITLEGLGTRQCSLFLVLTWSFYWTKSPEGREFWAKVFRELRTLEDKLRTIS